MPLYIGLAVTGLVYGGLHCFALNAPSATKVEALLWRLSSIAIMLTFAVVLLFYFWKLSSPFWVDPDDSAKIVTTVVGYMAVPVVWLAGPLPLQWEDRVLKVIIYRRSALPLLRGWFEISQLSRPPCFIVLRGFIWLSSVLSVSHIFHLRFMRFRFGHNMCRIFPSYLGTYNVGRFGKE